MGIIHIGKCYGGFCNGVWQKGGGALETIFMVPDVFESIEECYDENAVSIS